MVANDELALHVPSAVKQWSAYAPDALVVEQSMTDFLGLSSEDRIIRVCDGADIPDGLDVTPGIYEIDITMDVGGFADRIAFQIWYSTWLNTSVELSVSEEAALKKLGFDLPL
eukprot:scaffold19110_cov17-Prasinocladus_malaysianus.AAC.1